jgi:4-hydroxy-tetrahydrodipicolinate reductase
MSSLGVVGASGRLGSAILAAAPARRWEVTLRADRRSGWVESSVPDVVIDVSHPQALAGTVEYCVANDRSVLYGVSELGRDGHRLLSEAAKAVPVLIAPNFAEGHRLQRRALSALLLAASPRSGGDWRAAVRERHPTTKRDAPSATALALLDQLNLAGLRAARLDCEREGPPVSDHEVIFTREGEEVRLFHRVGGLIAAASGALRAAEWVLGAPAGLWSLEDVEMAGLGASEDAGSEQRAIERGGRDGAAGD